MCHELYVRNSKTVRCGVETISLLSPKIWAVIPKNIKYSSSFPFFKKSARKWKPNCPCHLTVT